MCVVVRVCVRARVRVCVRARVCVCMCVGDVPKKNKAVILVSSCHHSPSTDDQTGKQTMIIDYNHTKGGSIKNVLTIHAIVKRVIGHRQYFIDS